MKRILPDLARAPAAVAARGGELGRPLHLMTETTSTSDEAKHAAKAGAPHGSTWVAESQLAGRGRQGRVWVSSPGESLLFSVLVRVTCAPARLPTLALVAGLSVRDAVTRAAPGADVRLKWPNDVVVMERAGGSIRFKKIAGVLLESSLAGRKVEAVVVGIGVNVHTRDFPGELASQATSVALIAESPPDRAELLADILGGLDHDLSHVAARGLGVVHARLSAADALLGARVRSEQEEGTGAGIDVDGRLVVRRDDGTRSHWGAGEVHLL